MRESTQHTHTHTKVVDCRQNGKENLEKLSQLQNVCSCRE